jgi:diphthamide biosynthesis enzyme Dph1/Dph2-like protein
MGLPNECLVYALADTSYGECCIDDVTASHASANDMIVHFGHTCFSTKGNIIAAHAGSEKNVKQLLYVLGRSLEKSYFENMKDQASAI